MTAVLQHAVQVGLGRRRLHLDVETFSECDLKVAGAYRYAEHPSTELLCLVYRFGDGDPHLWAPAGTPLELLRQAALRHPGCTFSVGPLPQELADHVRSGGEVRAHNAQFERVILNGVAGRKVEFPPLKIEQMVCTAAKMAAHGLPRKLEVAAEALDSHRKNAGGKSDMLALSQPRRGKVRRWTPENAPARFVNLYAYCVDDVKAEHGIDNIVPDLTPYEQRVYQLDQLINDRGVMVDLPTVDDVLMIIAEYKLFLEAAMEKATRPDHQLDPGLKPTQREKIADWIRANGYPQLQDMQAETVKKILQSAECPDNCKHVLHMYSTYGMKAVAKYDVLMEMVCKDGRLHGMFLYHGAGTGRWSSTGVQLQNLFRPLIDDPDTAIAMFSWRSLEVLRVFYDIDPMKVMASCVRGMLVAPPGSDLLFLDFAGIESRVNAWLWGEEWKLKAFREYDAGTGPDLYKLAYARAFQVPIGSVTKKQRQIGKVMELALGYEGGVNAFVTMVDTYGIDLAELTAQVYPILPEDVVEQAVWMIEKFGDQGLPRETFIACDGLKQLWRRDNPKIVAGWKTLSNAAKMAILNPGKVYPAGKILFKVESQWLYMRLPSGRKLAYFRPSIDWEQKRSAVNGRIVSVDDMYDKLGNLDLRKATIRYWGIDTKTRQYRKTHTYGGKEDENADQGISRDLLVYAMFRLEDAGYPCIGSVHDEAIMEILKSFGSLDEASRIMCTQDQWAVGIPIAVEGHRAERYRK